MAKFIVTYYDGDEFEGGLEYVGIEAESKDDIRDQVESALALAKTSFVERNKVSSEIAQANIDGDQEKVLELHEQQQRLYDLMDAEVFDHFFGSIDSIDELNIYTLDEFFEAVRSN